MRFFSPDAVAVPAGASPTGETITVTPRAEPPAPQIVQPEPWTKEKPIRQAGVKVSKVDVAKELGLSEAPSDAIKREAARVRDENGKFIKTPKDFGQKEEPKPVAKLGEPTPKEEAKQAATKPVETAAPGPIAKIKIGDQEKTAEEWAAWHKELEEKSKAAAKAPESEVKPAPEKKPEEIAAEEKKRRDDWYAQTVKGYTPTENELDAILGGGPEAAKAYASHFARVEENVRNWITKQMNPHLEKLYGFEQPIKSMTERDQQIAQYQAENDFLAANQDIQKHPEGIKTMRELAAELHAEHDDILQLLAANPNTPNAQRYRDRAETLEKQFLPELSKEIKFRLGINGSASVVQAAATTAVAPTPAKPRPPAPGGNLSSTPSPRKTSSDAAGVAELMKHPRW